MFAALPIPAARTQIYLVQRPYVSKKRPIRPSQTLAQSPIISNSSNERLSKPPLNPSQSIDLQKPELYNSLLGPAARPAYVAPVLAEQLPLFLERELLSLFDDTRLLQAERVLEYLARAESREIDPWAQDDIRVSWLTVLYAARGFEQPWEYAFWSYYGKHPSKAIPIWLERWAARDAALGPGLAEDEEIYPRKRFPQTTKSSKKDEGAA